MILSRQTSEYIANLRNTKKSRFMTPDTPAPIVRPFTLRSLVVFVIVLCAAGVAIRVSWLALPWVVRNFMAPGAIHVVQASLGGTCGGSDLTAVAAERCEGRYACDIAIGFAAEPAKTCTRDFAVSWSCGRAPDVRLSVLTNVRPTSKTSIVCQDPREAAK